MTYKPPKFGDVYEWDVPTGTVRWFVIAPSMSGVAGEWEALLLQSTPMFASDPALYRPTTVTLEAPITFRGAPKYRLTETR